STSASASREKACSATSSSGTAASSTSSSCRCSRTNGGERAGFPLRTDQRTVADQPRPSPTDRVRRPVRDQCLDERSVVVALPRAWERAVVVEQDRPALVSSACPDEGT